MPKKICYVDVLNMIWCYIHFAMILNRYATTGFPPIFISLCIFWDGTCESLFENNKMIQILRTNKNFTWAFNPAVYQKTCKVSSCKSLLLKLTQILQQNLIRSENWACHSDPEHHKTSSWLLPHTLLVRSHITVCVEMGLIRIPGLLPASQLPQNPHKLMDSNMFPNIRRTLTVKKSNFFYFQFQMHTFILTRLWLD